MFRDGDLVWTKIVVTYDEWLKDEIDHFTISRNNDIWLMAYEECRAKLHEFMRIWRSCLD